MASRKVRCKLIKRKVARGLPADLPRKTKDGDRRHRGEQTYWEGARQKEIMRTIGQVTLPADDGT